MPTLVLTVIGDDRSGLVRSLADVVAAHEGNWERSQMAELAGAFAGIVVVRLPAAQVDSFKDAVAGLDGLSITAHDADAEVAAPPAALLRLELLGNDRPGIVKELSGVLSDHGLSIEELETSIRDAPMSGGQLFEALIIAPVGPDADVESLRADLERLASELMVDITVTDETA